MAQNAQNEVVGAEPKSLKEMGNDVLNAVKGPVFWLTVGFLICKYIDRKKKTVVS